MAKPIDIILQSIMSIELEKDEYIKRYIKNRKNLKKDKFSTNQLDKEHKTKLAEFDNRMDKVENPLKIKGYKSIKTSRNAYNQYKILVSNQEHSLIEVQRENLASVSDGGQTVKHIANIGNTEEHYKQFIIDKKYEEGELSKKDLNREIARLKAREKNNVYANRNSKIKVAKALHKNLERQWIEQQIDKGSIELNPDGSIKFAKGEEGKIANAKWKNLQNSYKKLTPDEYVTYYARKTGREGKYKEGFEYDYKTGELESSR